MDSYRDHPSDFDPASETPEAPDSGISAIGSDERRMHVRAYNYWVSLLDGRDYPSIEDLEPGDLSDFAPHSVLLDFTSGREHPATPYVGAAIRTECDLPDEVQTIADVPKRSLLSRLTDHYMQIIANRAPVGFEAEFENQRGENICYRGILMPFSSDGDTIDFIYGVINWKKVGVSIESAVAESAPQPAPVPDARFAEEEPLELDQPVESGSEAAVVPFAQDVAGDGPVVPFDTASAVEPGEDGDSPTVTADEATDEPQLAAASPGAGIDLDEATIELGADAGLADCLWAARECAETVKAAEGRTREALYRALSQAYDFAVASKAEPEDYADLLEESGMKAQARAPMTPIVKLVFGIDYDKARLTEYSAALAYAERQDVEPGGFLGFIEAQAGGLKALVAAERLARRPEPKADTKTAKARERLRSATPMALDSIDSEEEFALVLTRRSSGGVHEAVAVVEDQALVEKAIRRVGA